MHWPGIEPGPPAWQASILPLNHQCLSINVFYLHIYFWIKLIAFTILLILSQLSDMSINFAYARLRLLFVLNFTFYSEAFIFKKTIST